MLVQKRDLPHASQLTFVVFFRYRQAPGKMWSCRVRHLYKEKLDLKKEDKVHGTVYAEWRQVGSGMHHMLEVGSKLAEAPPPLFAARLGGPAEDLSEHTASHWEDLWKQEDTKKDLTTRCYWQAYRCDGPEVQVIDDDDEDEVCGVDVEQLVEGAFRKLEGFVASKVKSEVLKARLMEKRAPIASAKEPTNRRMKRSEEAFGCCFVDPYADVCKAQRDQLSDPPSHGNEVPKSTPVAQDLDAPASTTDECQLTQENEKGRDWVESERKWDSYPSKRYDSWGGGRRRWRDWNEDWQERSQAKRRYNVPLPPPPPAKRIDNFCHLLRPVQPYFGVGTTGASLNPLKLFRRILETEGICAAGHEEAFKVNGMERVDKERERATFEYVHSFRPS